MTESKPPVVRTAPKIPGGLGPLGILAVAAVSLAPLVAIGIAERDVFARWLPSVPLIADPTAAPDYASLGPTRAGVLAEITREAAAEDGFRSGGTAAFPPIEYINRKLAERGEKWRVSLSPEGPLVARDIS